MHVYQTTPFYLGGSTEHGYLEAYASRIQHSVTLYPRRVSLDWRFLNQHETNAVRVVERLRIFSGWHTIAFQVAIEDHIGDAMVQIATDTFLKHSDNYYVRIDEVYTLYWNPVPTTSPHHSTLVINGNALDPVERRVHEDVCPYSRPPIQCDGVPYSTASGAVCREKVGVEDDANLTFVYTKTMCHHFECNPTVTCRVLEHHL